MYRFALLAAASLSVAAPALAQTASPGTAVATGTAPALPDPNDQRDTLTIGVGGAYLPDYEGSDDYRIIPAAAIRGRYKGIGFSTRGTFLYLDLVPRGSGKLSFSAGPIAGVRLNRTGKIKDDVVDLLPERKTAIEVGGFAGLSYHGLTNPYDSLGIRVDVVHDVAKAHRSTIISPTVEFGTPLSRTTYVGVSAALDFAQDKYARYYFGITPGEALVSGLPTYNPGGGLKDWRVGLLANQSLNGDLLGGLSLFGTASYSKLQGDFKRSPIVAQRGSSSQWLGAVGLAYTF